MDVAENVPETPKFSESHWWHHKGINKWPGVKQAVAEQPTRSVHPHQSEPVVPLPEPAEQNSEAFEANSPGEEQDATNRLGNTDWSRCRNSSQLHTLLTSSVHAVFFQLHFVCSWIKWLYGVHWEGKKTDNNHDSKSKSKTYNLVALPDSLFRNRDHGGLDLLCDFWAQLLTQINVRLLVSRSTEVNLCTIFTVHNIHWFSRTCFVKQIKYTSVA